MKSSEKKLIEDYFAQSISEEDISSLNELLLNSEEARSFYLTYASVMENLDESRQAHNLYNFGPSKATRFPRKKAGKWMAIAASIIFAVVSLNHFAFQKTLKTDHGIEVNSKNLPKIKLIDFFGLDASHHSFTPGQTQFEVGEYKTSSGKLHLRFGESVDVIFTGASIFEILSEKEIFVQKGNIRTNVHDARGYEFTIRTPSANYIDWGTEFCLIFVQMPQTSWKWTKVWWKLRTVKRSIRSVNLHLIISHPWKTLLSHYSIYPVTFQVRQATPDGTTRLQQKQKIQTCSGSTLLEPRTRMMLI